MSMPFGMASMFDPEVPPAPSPRGRYEELTRIANDEAHMTATETKHVFHVESRTPKGGWKLAYLVEGQRSKAELVYAGLGTGRGKRLVQMDGGKKKVLFRAFGY